MKWVENVLTLCEFANFVLFLKDFKYRSFTERILKIKLSRYQENVSRQLDFTYINRVLVWNVLGNALTSFLPFLNISQISSFFNSTNSLSGYANVDSSEIDNLCTICQTTQIINVAEIEACKHKFCYYCIKLHSLSEKTCPVCKEEIDQIKSLALKN